MGKIAYLVKPTRASRRLPQRELFLKARVCAARYHLTLSPNKPRNDKSEWYYGHRQQAEDYLQECVFR